MKSNNYTHLLANRKKIKALLNAEPSIIGQSITICGWIRTIRHQKQCSFIEVNDGSSLANFQIITHMQSLDHLSTGASVAITGTIVESPGNNQSYEMQSDSILLIGECPSDYLLQKKRHSFDFLRTIAHLRPRTNTQGAVARVRNRLAYATHQFFQDKGFLYLQSPIITSNDCEGAGEMFQVSTLDLQNPKKHPDGAIDYSKDFFSKPTFLTVSGQLNAEAYATALSDIYTFGPTFRSENSHTSRHLAEFWMIEPEMAFADLPIIMGLAEDYLKALIQDALEHCSDDLAFFNQFIQKGLIDRLTHTASSPFTRITYTEAIEILKKASCQFEYPPVWGNDLQSEHERYLSETHCKTPVIVTDYPKTIKAFYMRDNEDNKTVAAMDVLVPNVGEIIGGAQREERLPILQEKLTHHKLDPQEYQWYLDLRKYGSVPHGGFGLGFERLVQFITGMDNIRDVVAFPRVSGSCHF